MHGLSADRDLFQKTDLLYRTHFGDRFSQNPDLTLAPELTPLLDGCISIVDLFC